MAKAAFDRDNILTPEERLKSAVKCIDLLVPHVDAMGEIEAEFVSDMQEKIGRSGVSERQLAWLRDLTGKYAQ